jgi:hypothetical protein
MVRIELPKGDLVECGVFSVLSARTQQDIEFGDKSTKPRDVMEIARDNLIGKLAEKAFANFLRDEFEITVDLDFGIYPRGVWDNNDITLYNSLIDIKATRSGGRWLLIELNKLRFREKENKLPDYFVFNVTGWNRDKDVATGIVDIMGYCSREDISRATNFLKKGDCIPGTRTKLQTDNFAKHMADLETDWNRLIVDITGRDKKCI